MERIDVCCALIWKEDQLLACQRGSGTDHPLLWEFPGGKIEAGETEEQCIIREIQEELGVTIRVWSRLSPISHDYPQKKIRLIPLLCEITCGEVECHEHEACRWFSINEFQLFNWSEADLEVILKNKSVIEKPWK